MARISRVTRGLRQASHAAVAVVIAFMCCAHAHAHDLGVARIEVHELDDDRLAIVTADAFLANGAHPPPRLPVGLEFDGPSRPREAWNGRVLRYVITGCASIGEEATLSLDWSLSAALVVRRPADGREETALIRGRDGIVVIPVGRAAPIESAGVAAFTVLGIEHILAGFDHLLFVLGLVLIVPGAIVLVKTITAFTIAHSLTLALAMLDVIQLRPAPVEAVIALSIVLLAREACRRPDDQPSFLRRWPWIVALGFGLVHGLGFAGAMSEIDMSRDALLPALVGFNLGVELGQLAFIGVVTVAATALRAAVPAHTGQARLGIAYAMGAVSTCWFVERIVGVL